MSTIFFNGTFKPDERWQRLYDKFEQYYKDTPDSMNNKDALPFWKKFNEWCNINGYTRDEVNDMKKSIRPTDTGPGK